MVYLLIYTIVLCLPAIIGSAVSRKFTAQGRRRLGLSILIWGLLLGGGALYLWVQASTGLSMSPTRPFGLPPALAGLLMAAPGLVAAVLAIFTGTGMRTRAALGL